MTVELHTLTGAYAAHAVSPEEAAEFEAHLPDCTSCPQETRELIATTARMGEAEFDAPPAELKSRIMAEVARTRQLPPPPGLTPPAVDLAARRPNRLLVAVAASVAALAIIGGGIAGGIAYRANQNTHRVEASQALIASVLSAADARTVAASGPDGSHGTAVVSDLKHAAVFAASSWPKPPDSKVFQLWVIDSSGAHSAGLLHRQSDGTLAPVYTKDVAATGANFGVTLEPSGGSKQPTTKPVLLMPLHG
ncbi:MAG: anti-sigma factor [Actinomycetota bacterium]|nr:anti-sigma factor [Actinomycetota bacterium]